MKKQKQKQKKPNRVTVKSEKEFDMYVCMKLLSTIKTEVVKRKRKRLSTELLTVNLN